MTKPYCSCKINPYKAKTIPIETKQYKLYICSACLKPPLHVWHLSVDVCLCGALYASPFVDACRECASRWAGWSDVQGALEGRFELGPYRAGKIPRISFRNLLTSWLAYCKLNSSEGTQDHPPGRPNRRTYYSKPKEKEVN